MIATNSVKDRIKSIQERIDEISKVVGSFEDGRVPIPQEEDRAKQIFQEEQVISNVRFLCTAIKGVIAISKAAQGKQPGTDLYRGVVRALGMWGITPEQATIIFNNKEKLQDAVNAFENHVIDTIMTY